MMNFSSLFKNCPTIPPKTLLLDIFPLLLVSLTISSCSDVAIIPADLLFIPATIPLFSVFNIVALIFTAPTIPDVFAYRLLESSLESCVIVPSLEQL